MKRIIAVAAIFVMLATLSSCTQKTHFKFEKITNANFREKTQFFAFNDLIYVIDRDRLVCMNPDNGQMLESVDLPGYPTDIATSLVKTADLSMIFKTKDGYMYKDYTTSETKPYIKENKLMNVSGSRFINQDDYPFYRSEFFVTNETRTTLSYYDNYQHKSSIEFKSTTLISSLGTNQPLVAYDGERLSYIGTEKGKLKENYKPKDYKSPYIWDIPTEDISSCILSTDMDFILVYNGKSIYRIELFFNNTISSIDSPSRIKSISKGQLTHYLGCEDGLYFMKDLLPEPIKLLDERIKPIGDSVSLSLFDGSFAIAGEKIGDRYKLVGIREYFYTEEKNAKKPSPPGIFTFDDLPEGTFAIGLAEINYDLRVYAFTSTGYYRSEVIYHDSHMEDFMKDIPSKQE